MLVYRAPETLVTNSYELTKNSIIWITEATLGYC